uniref:Uncharacterized protein n=1 Tax=Romanomermis culicivorax TaxID=13658 RepID=A0A915JT90_ROMCU
MPDQKKISLENKNSIRELIMDALMRYVHRKSILDFYPLGFGRSLTMGITYTKMAAYNRASKYNEQGRIKNAIKKQSENVNVVRNVKKFSQYWGAGLDCNATYRKNSRRNSTNSARNRL